MKKLSLLLFVLLFSFTVSADEEVNCIESNAGSNVYSANFPLIPKESSYCDIPLEFEGFKLRVELKNGVYEKKDVFTLMINSYIIREQAYLSTKSKTDQIDCSSWPGLTLDLESKVTQQGMGGHTTVSGDNFPYLQDCGVGYKWYNPGAPDKILASLNIQRATKQIDIDAGVVPVRAKAIIKIEVKKDAVKNYFSEQFKNIVSQADPRNKEGEFTVYIDREQAKLLVIPETVIRINLERIDYQENKAFFKLTNIEENEEELCKVEAFFDGKDAKFENCGLAEVKIEGLNPTNKPLEDSRGVGYKFKYFVNPKDPGVVDKDAEPAEDSEVCENKGEERTGCEKIKGCPGKQICKDGVWSDCIDIPGDGCPAATPSGDLTENQKALNQAILKKYYEEIFKVDSDTWSAWVK